ncbi:hypothetical protein H6P81_003559 [Aristolochia fimbriata]|uniref:Uncharacterized protein n=1 Tax=Aristolochia fimbriata TaxID=158543 RepID=A0AAV7FDZ6_ARIFI|nr:hypothetical protein H6P81_003559 [Aristolochia fimbriata]
MQSSVTEDQEVKDQRNNSTMEDSAAMTIEFLRARLLSERSVSRTAKQRADQLAKRVVELEEQLQIVTSQRKKAEKAATEVLTILENHGISDFSEAFDSNSDQDGFEGDWKGSDNSMKEEKHHMTAKSSKDDVEDGLSSSELEASSTPGRCLSWKSGSHNHRYYEKKTLSQPRRRPSGFSYTSGSSSKRQLGKSCRQIKRREMGEAQEDVRDASQNGLAVGTGEIANTFESRPETSNGVSPSEEEKAFPNDIDAYSLTHPTVHSVSSTHEKDEKDVEMEKAIEQQAQLIVLYQAQENAQREWEEKYREDNGCSVELCEPGNHSDVTEEQNTSKTESAAPVETVPPFQEEQKAKKNDARGSAGGMVSNSFTPSSPIAYNQDSITSSSGECQTSSQGLATFGSQDYMGVQVQKLDWSFGNGSNVVNDIASRFQSHSPGILDNPAVGSDSSSQSFPKEDSVGDKKNQLTIVNQTPNCLDNVLEALQSAKLSLRQELYRMPSSSHAITTMSSTTDDQVLAMEKTHAPMEIPVGCAPLFRLPTELQTVASSYPDFQRRHSDVGLNLTGGFPELGIGGGERNLSSAHTDFARPGHLSNPFYDTYLDSPMLGNRYPQSSPVPDLPARLPPTSPYNNPDAAGMLPQLPYYHPESRSGMTSVPLDSRIGMTSFPLDSRTGMTSFPLDSRTGMTSFPLDSRTGMTSFPLDSRTGMTSFPLDSRTGMTQMDQYSIYDGVHLNMHR